MPRPPSSLPDVVMLVVVVFVILFVGIAVVNTTAEETVDRADGQRVHDAALLDGSGTWVSLADTTGSNETVYDSRGYAVNLTGSSDSYTATDREISIAADDTWTVSVWAWVDAGSAGDDMTVLNADGTLILSYNGSTSEWRAWHYDTGSRQSYSVAVSAPNQPQTWTNLMAVSNGSALTLYRNNTASASVNLSSSAITTAPVNNSNFDGRLEEIDTFDDTLDGSARQAIVDDPVAPRPGDNRTARVMFDEPYRSGQYVFYTAGPATMTAHNATFADGFAGEEMQPGEIAALGDDYEWDSSGPRLRPIGGGELDSAPVAYVDYDASTVGPGSLVDRWTSAIQFAGLLPTIVILGYVVMRLRRVRS